MLSYVERAALFHDFQHGAYFLPKLLLRLFLDICVMFHYVIIIHCVFTPTLFIINYQSGGLGVFCLFSNQTYEVWKHRRTNLHPFP